MKKPSLLTFSLSEAEVKDAIVQYMKKVAKIDVEAHEVHLGLDHEVSIIHTVKSAQDAKQ